MSDLTVSTDKTPFVEKQPGYGTQSGQKEEVRSEGIGTRIFNALAWFFNLINPFSCCMSSAQGGEASNQGDAMERGDLAQRVSLPAPRGVIEERQVPEKQYEIIDIGGGRTLKLEIRPPVQRQERIEVQREKRVVAKPVDFPAERVHIRKLEKKVGKLESRLAQIDRDLGNPKLKETSQYEIFEMLGSKDITPGSRMGDLVRVLETNRKIERLKHERPDVDRELNILRTELQDFRNMVNLPEVI